MLIIFYKFPSLAAKVTLIFFIMEQPKTAQKSVSKTKKCSERIKRWVSDRKDAAGNQISIHDHPSTFFDSILLLGMLFGVFSVVCQIKIMAWISIFLSFHCAGQSRGEEDFRQIATGFLISITSLCMLYMKDPSPMEW